MFYAEGNISNCFSSLAIVKFSTAQTHQITGHIKGLREGEREREREIVWEV